MRDSRALVLLRLTLVVATGYLLIARGSAALHRSWPLFGLLAAAIASNLLFRWLPRRVTGTLGFTASLIVFDTLWVTGALLYSGHFAPEFFYLYFFVLFLAAVGERIGLIALGSVVVAGAYLWVLARQGGPTVIWTSATLVPIPFLFAVAIFYGYFVDRLRAEERKTREEALAAARSGEALRGLAEAHRRLAAEVEERRRAEGELRTLSRALEQSATMVAVTDADARVEYVNPSFAERTGWTLPGIAARGLRDLFAEEESSAVTRPGRDTIAAALDDRAEWHGEVRVRPAAGDPFWAAAAISPIRDDAGVVTHHVAVLEDVSERRRAADQIQRANVELQELNALKTAFVSIVSHELRTPVTAIKNAVQLVARSGPLSTDQVRFLDMAERNLGRLAMILCDLLMVSKLDAGKLALRFTAVDLEALVEDLLVPYAPQAAESGLRFSLEVAAGLSPVWADAQRVGQVLTNLVSNAFKFTPRNGAVTVRIAPQAAGIEIAVEDTGVGIAPADQQRVFERFVQVEDVLTRENQGSGLGLSIARDLVAAHGGELTLDSQPGRGSRFAFVLPMHTPRAEEMTRLDATLAELRGHSSVALLVAVPAAAPSGEREEPAALAERLRTLLPKSSDLVVAQPAWGRVVLALPNTDEVGGRVVVRRLGNQLAAGGATPPRLLGPGIYPRDGGSAWRVLERALDTAPAGSTADRPAAAHQPGLSTTVSPCSPLAVA